MGSFFVVCFHIHVEANPNCHWARDEVTWLENWKTQKIPETPINLQTEKPQLVASNS